MAGKSEVKEVKAPVKGILKTPSMSANAKEMWDEAIRASKDGGKFGPAKAFLSASCHPIECDRDMDRRQCAKCYFPWMLCRCKEKVVGGEKK